MKTKFTLKQMLTLAEQHLEARKEIKELSLQLKTQRKDHVQALDYNEGEIARLKGCLTDKDALISSLNASLRDWETRHRELLAKFQSEGYYSGPFTETQKEEFWERIKKVYYTPLTDSYSNEHRWSKIAAIKLYRELFNSGLKEAKDAIEAKYQC